MAATKILSDTVLNAALAVVETCTEARVVESDDTELITGITLNSGNYTQAAGAGSPGGRQTTCLVSDAADMLAISVAVTGAAKKIELLLSGTVHVTAVLTSAVSVTSADQVNLGTFIVVFPDPT